MSANRRWRRPNQPLRCFGAAFQKCESLFIGRNQTGARACLNRHIAQGHAPFHGERLNGRPGIFQHIAGAAGGSADFADNGQRNVFRRDMRRGLADNINAEVFAFA